MIDTTKPHLLIKCYEGCIPSPDYEKYGYVNAELALRHLERLGKGNIHQFLHDDYNKFPESRRLTEKQFLALIGRPDFTCVSFSKHGELWECADFGEWYRNEKKKYKPKTV